MVEREQALSAIRARLGRAAARFGGTWAERAVALTMLVCIVAGLFFRARGFFFEASALWLDECIWAMNLTTRPLVQNLIRPPGFILVSKALVTVFSPTEMVLRALPWTAGVALTVASPWIARRLYQSPASRLLFVAIIALNPCAIDFSKEFKPYSIGLGLHLALVALALRYVESHSGRELVAVLVTAVLGSIFAQDLVFAYPGLFVVMGWEAMKHRRQHLPVVAAAAFVIIACLLAQYFFLWRNMPHDGAEYWGKKYNVFHTGEQKRSYLSWAFERYRDMTGLPGIRRDYWQEGGVTFETRQQLRVVDRVIWLAVHLMGLMVMAWRRRWREALLLVLPLGVLWVFNAVDRWPMGAFRTNVFTLGYMAAIAGMAFDVQSDGRAARWFWTVPTIVMVFLPIGVFEHVWHARKQAFTYDSRFPKLMQRMAAIRQTRGKAPLILDRRSCDPWKFYTRFHPETSREYAPQLDKSYDAFCIRYDGKIPEELLARATSRQAVWIVLHVGHDLDRLVRSGKLFPLMRISRFEVGPHTVMSFRRRPERAAPNEASP